MSKLNESQLITKIGDFAEEARRGHAIWVEEATKCFDYYIGNQWSSGQLNRLKKAGRPALTFNYILPVINLLSGLERQNRRDVVATNKRGGSRMVAEALSCLVKHSLDVCNGEFESSMAFLDGAVTGKGWLGLDISYQEDHYNGDLIMERISPFDIAEDPNVQDYDLNKTGQYIIRSYWSVKDRVKLLYPKKEKEIDTATASANVYDVFHVARRGDRTTAVREEDSRYRVRETWWKDYQKRYFLIDLSTMTEHMVHRKKVGLAKQVVNFERQRAEEERRAEKFALVERVVPVLMVTTSLGDLILEDVEDPLYGFSDFPFMRFAPYWADKHCFGVVINTIDPQDEINKRYSQSLHLLNQSANSGWFNKKTGGANKKVLQRFGSTPGIVVEYETEKPERIIPSDLSSGHMTLAGLGEVHIKKITGLNSDALGHESERHESGVAILRRQKQGFLINEGIFDNFAYTQRILGKAMVELVRRSNIYTNEEIMALVGDVHPDAKPEEMVRAIKDMGLGRYTIKVTERPSSPTVRIANFESLLRMAEAGLPIPMDVLIENSDIPNKEEIVARIQQQMQAAAQVPDQAPQSRGSAPKNQPTADSQVSP